MPRFDLTAKVINQTQPVRGVSLLVVKAPQISETARPGQFCMLDVTSGNSSDPLLRRPLSIHTIDRQGAVTFLYRHAGRGTHLLSQRSAGDTVQVLGPLGHGFRMAPEIPPIIIGGGLGVAPLLFLAERLPESLPITIILGGRTKTDLLALDRFTALGHKVLKTTEDGSLGTRGLVTDALAGILDSWSSPDPCIFTCGPWPMMKAVYHMARNKNIQCQVSLEAGMACGIGLCLGCAVPRSDNQGFLHVCKQGPVFHADQVHWESSQ